MRGCVLNEYGGVVIVGGIGHLGRSFFGRSFNCFVSILNTFPKNGFFLENLA